MRDVVDVCVVIPVYNEAPNVDPLLARLEPVLQSLGQSWRVLFVDDGSQDDTVSVVRCRQADRPRIELLALTRNFGHQTALQAGMDYARGRYVITMDGDLQHPPETIPEMLRLAREGHDVVQTRRHSHARLSPFKRWSSSLFYRVFNVLSKIPIIESSSDFRLLTEKALQVLRRMPERHRFLRGMLPWTGLKVAVVTYEEEARFAGQPKYSPWRSLSLALDAAVSFSRVPLQLATVCGLLTTIGCFAYFAFSITAHLTGLWTAPGWTSIIASVLFIGGVQLMFIGVVGEYVGRIYEEVKQRPLYVVAAHTVASDAAGRGSSAMVEPPAGEEAKA
ncbi:MAG TPA: glycosyltransferase family 2 protein [Candidatus Xenobia bacterium]|jgi:dolichol-phosphate mannosyltransferase